jgi:hypothetical protein
VNLSLKELGSMSSSLKLAYSLFIVGLALMPLHVFPKEFFFSLSSIVFMLCFLFFGIHIFKNASSLSNGNTLLTYVYRSDPFTLPLISVAIRYLFR